MTGETYNLADELLAEEHWSEEQRELLNAVSTLLSNNATSFRSRQMIAAVLAVGWQLERQNRRIAQLEAKLAAQGRR